MRFVVVLALLASCYDVPRPECGFQCGPDGECPGDYHCVLGICELQDGVDGHCPPIDMPDITDPPRVMATDPQNGEFDVTLDRPVLVTFDENVTNVTETTFQLRRVDEPEFIQGTVSPVGEGQRAFRFTPIALEKNAMYEVRLSDEIRDVDHLSLIPAAWTFRTVLDSTGPRVAASVPEHSARNVSTTIAITIRFDEPVVVPPDSISLIAPQSIVPTSIVAQSDTMFQLVYTPPLLDNTLYKIGITSAVTDVYGNPFVPLDIPFSTHDTIAPKIVTTDPLDGATDVASGMFPIEVLIFFDEDVIVNHSVFHLTSPAGDVPFSFFYDPQMFVADLSPNELEPGTTYTVAIDPLTDRAGNTATFAPFSFTTAP